jgi:organic hydroperoxide reductase OsmC/OhrA
MKISATIKNELNSNVTLVSTNDQSKSISIAPKETGFGSSINGGELLALSLAVCYCNDIYREAAKRNLRVTKVHVEVTTDFGSEGEAGHSFRYKPTIESTATSKELQELIEHTDSVAEIHKTLRQGVNIQLTQ